MEFMDDDLEVWCSHIKTEQHMRQLLDAEHCTTCFNGVRKNCQAYSACTHCWYDAWDPIWKSKDQNAGAARRPSIPKTDQQQQQDPHPLDADDNEEDEEWYKLEAPHVQVQYQ